MKDYSLYIYYKGSDNYPNNKSRLFGFYEEMFDKSYKGSEEDKEDAFKDYMSDLLYEKASDMYSFGTPGVDKSESYREFLKEYFNPELNVEDYEPKLP